MIKRRMIAVRVRMSIEHGLIDIVRRICRCASTRKRTVTRFALAISTLASPMSRWRPAHADLLRLSRVLWDDLDAASDVCAWRCGALASQRRLHFCVRYADRDRLLRDLRRHRAGFLGASHVPSRSRQPLRRCRGARNLQFIVERAFPCGRRVLLRQPASGVSGR